MADIVDEAQERAAMFLRHSVAVALSIIHNGNDEDPLIINGVRCCLDCEKPIPLRRLKLQPNAKWCVPCQTKNEKRYAKGKS
ncbi:MAG: TraR/DksA C4-type zinc finger protein [Smithella sp.]